MTAADVDRLVELDRLTELRSTLKQAADAIVDGDANTLDIERYLRLAKYAVAQAQHHATTGEETSAPMFGFVFTALALLEPVGVGHYDVGLAEFSGLAFDAVSAITEFARRGRSDGGTGWPAQDNDLAGHPTPDIPSQDVVLVQTLAPRAHPVTVLVCYGVLVRLNVAGVFSAPVLRFAVTL